MKPKPRSRTPGPLTLTEEDRRKLAPWAADCAERVLPIFEAHAPEDRRPREAIAGVRAFARGELKVGPLRALAAAAHAAARAAADPAAVAAARAAGHAAAVAHMAAHARGVAYAVLAAPDREAELRWQASRAKAAVRAVLAKLPPPVTRGGALGELIRELNRRMQRRKR